MPNPQPLMPVWTAPTHVPVSPAVESNGTDLTSTTCVRARTGARVQVTAMAQSPAVDVIAVGLEDGQFPYIYMPA